MGLQHPLLLSLCSLQQWQTVPHNQYNFWIIDIVISCVCSCDLGHSNFDADLLAQLKVHGDASQKSTYAYYFTEQFKLDPPVFPVPNWIVNNSADHGDDLPFVFGGVYLKGSNIVTGTHTLSMLDTLDTICKVLLCQKMLPNHTRMRSIITRTYLYVCFNAAFSPALCALH